LSGIDVEWEFRPRTDLLSNYHSLNEARIAVSTSSSLGYEALGRGIRTAFFMLDPQVTGNFGDRFGWPEPLEDSGEIWTNFLDRQKTIDILSRLHDMTDDSWADLQRRFVPRMISSDPGNTLLKSLIRDSLDNR
jgi:surface carbohydrate biosynthesis protein